MSIHDYPHNVNRAIQDGEGVAFQPAAQQAPARAGVEVLNDCTVDIVAHPPPLDRLNAAPAGTHLPPLQPSTTVFSQQAGQPFVNADAIYPVPQHMTAAAAAGAPDPKHQICFDFTKGQCSRGAACKFSHDINLIIRVNSQEKGICFDFLKGTCSRGVLCRFSHDLQNLQVPLQQSLLQHPMQQHQPVQQQTLPAANPAAPPAPRRHLAPICYDFVKGQCSRGSECRYSHDYAAILYGPGKAAGRDPLTVCVDYTRGRCMRGANCRYRHDNPMATAAVAAAAAAAAAAVAQGRVDPAFTALGLGGGMAPGMAGGPFGGMGPEAAHMQMALTQALLASGGGHGSHMQQAHPSVAGNSGYNAMLEQLQRASLTDATAGRQPYNHPHHHQPAAPGMSALSMALSAQQQQSYAAAPMHHPYPQHQHQQHPQHMYGADQNQRVLEAQRHMAQQAAQHAIAIQHQLNFQHPQHQERQSQSGHSSLDSHPEGCMPDRSGASPPSAGVTAPSGPAPVLVKMDSLRTSNPAFKQPGGGQAGGGMDAASGGGALPSPHPHDTEFVSDSPTIRAAWGSGSFQAVKSIWEGGPRDGPC